MRLSKEKRKYSDRNQEWRARQNRKKRKRNIGKRKKLIDEARDKPCVSCGSKESIHLHHPGEKNFQIGDKESRSSVSIGKLKKELALTVPLCEDCHRRRHGHVKGKEGNSEI